MVFFKRLNSVLWRVVEELTLFFFSSMLILAVAQILFRYVLNISVPWTEEAARWLFVWQIFLGSALMMKEKGHLKITMVRDMLPLFLQHTVDLIMSLIGLLFLIGIFWGSMQMMGSVQSISAGSFKLSMKFLYLVLPISSALMISVYITKIFKDIYVLSHKSPDNGDRNNEERLPSW